MKKIMTTTLSVLLLSALPLSIQANGQPPLLNVAGCTADAVRYEVHGTTYVQLTADSIFVTRQVSFDGFVVPSDKLFGQEGINQVTYSGTLKLASYSFNAKTQKTIAIYEGTLTSR